MSYTMSIAFKPVAELLLQARVNGKLMDTSDFYQIVQAHMISTSVDCFELSNFACELIHCDNCEEARRVANKYDLKIVC